MRVSEENLAFVLETIILEGGEGTFLFKLITEVLLLRELETTVRNLALEEFVEDFTANQSEIKVVAKLKEIDRL